jgi:hypothetical protein
MYVCMYVCIHTRTHLGLTHIVRSTMNDRNAVINDFVDLVKYLTTTHKTTIKHVNNLKPQNQEYFKCMYVCMYV